MCLAGSTFTNLALRRSRSSPISHEKDATVHIKEHRILQVTMENQKLNPGGA
jgi:hypothetical protein